MHRLSFVVLLIVHICNASFKTGVVDTTCGPVQGVLENHFGNEVWSFKGIPYGTPPLGKLRWQPSLPLTSCWQGTLQASQYGPKCVQFGSGDGQEDCLYINIWSNNLNNEESLVPVMFYIHGGSLVGGSGSDDPAWNLATTGKVVTVTFNYRLNAFGYLALDVLSENDPRGVSGNYGLLDQLLALQWVQQNIQYFGGDPSLVTIFGQSSGGTAVFELLMTPNATGLFHRAISMSGSPNISVPLAVAEEVHKQDFLANSPCATVSRDSLLDCLYNLDVSDIVNSMTSNWSPAWLFGIPAPGDTISPLSIVDGVTVPQSILNAFMLQTAVDVPIIFGVMHEEPDIAPVDIVFNYTSDQWNQFIQDRFSPFGASVPSQVNSLYPLANFSSPQQAYDSISCDIGDVCGNLALAAFASHQLKSNIYAYICTQMYNQPECSVEYNGYCPRYAWHGLDMILLFNLTADIGLPFGPSEQAFMELIMDHFIEFATTGTINSPAWMPFMSESGYYVTDFNEDEQLTENPKVEQCGFWEENGFGVYMWQN